MVKYKNIAFEGSVLAVSNLFLQINSKLVTRCFAKCRVGLEEKVICFVGFDKPLRVGR